MVTIFISLYFCRGILSWEFKSDTFSLLVGELYTGVFLKDCVTIPLPGLWFKATIAVPITILK